MGRKETIKEIRDEVAKVYNFESRRLHTAMLTHDGRPHQSSMTLIHRGPEFLAFLLEELGKLGDWEPIETAPGHDDFLVFMPEERAKIKAAEYHPNVKVIGGHFAFDLTKPTHWRPYPPFPEVDRATKMGKLGITEQDVEETREPRNFPG